MKAYLIARVSTDDQADALPAQTLRLLDYAKQRNYEYELFQIQESAYKGNREEFRKVVERIQSSPDHVVVVFDKIDRYSRDSSSEEKAVMTRLFKLGKIELHFPSDFLFITKDSPATDLFRLDMGIALGGYYSRAIHDNVMRRFEQKWHDGEITGPAPAGYRNVTLPNGKKWVEIEPSEAKAVKSAYEWYASGTYSMQLICKKLNREYGYQVRTSQMALILKNPFYKGEMIFKGKVFPHKYERIISEELYEQAKAVREGYAIRHKQWACLPYTYRSLIDCAECGCMVTFERKKQKYVYGHCTQAKGKHGAPYVLEDRITEQMQQAFESFPVTDEVISEVGEALRQEYEHIDRTREENLQRIDIEIGKVQSRIDRVYEDHLDGLIPQDFYERKFVEMRESLTVIKQRRKTFELMSEYNYGSKLSLLRVAKRAPELFERGDFERRRSLITLVLSNLQLDNGLLRWKLKKPFEMMAFCSKNANWLPLLDSN